MKRLIEEQLERFVKRERSEQEQLICSDDPDICDLCESPLRGERFIVDGEVGIASSIPMTHGSSTGQWAYMCASCFADRGVGIGWGKGQLYERTTAGTWLLVAGFPEQPSD